MNQNPEKCGLYEPKLKVRPRKFLRYHWIEDLQNSWAWVPLWGTQAFFSTVLLYEQPFSRYGVRAI